MDVMKRGIDQDILEKALRKQISNERIKILGISNRCLSDKGVNFLSDLFEVSIRYTAIPKNESKNSERSVDVIIKLDPTNGTLALVCQQDLFETELKILRDVLPKVEELIGLQIGPMLLYGCENPHILVMEHLCRRKFIMKDRQKGLSFEYCRLVIEKLAKFHAGSVAVFEKDPVAIEFYKQGGILSKKCPGTFFRMVEVSLIKIGKQIERWTETKCPESTKKLIRLSNTIREECLRVYEYDPDEFCVLNHGDCWINNMMFRENEEGQPLEVLLVDYQMAVYSSPVIDLHYFLNICPEFDLKYTKDDYFLEIYLNTLTDTMRKIGCKRKPPTLKELKEAMHRRRRYAVFSGVVLYLRMMANKEDTEDFCDLLDKNFGETKMDVFKNPEAMKLAHKMIPVMNERGYFD